MLMGPIRNLRWDKSRLMKVRNFPDAVSRLKKMRQKIVIGVKYSPLENFIRTTIYGIYYCTVLHNFTISTGSQNSGAARCSVKSTMMMVRQNSFTLFGVPVVMLYEQPVDYPLRVFAVCTPFVFETKRTMIRTRQNE